MRCAICDATLNPSEIAYNHDHDEFEPCGTCLEAIANVFEDHLDEDEVRVIVERDEREMFGDDESDFDEESDE